MNHRLYAVLLVGASAALSVTAACDDDDHDHSKAGGHTSPYPSCNEITQACHEVDVGAGPIHDCHDQAHAPSTTEALCAQVKDNCLRICAEAKLDAGTD